MSAIHARFQYLLTYSPAQFYAISFRRVLLPILCMRVHFSELYCDFFAYDTHRCALQSVRLFVCLSVRTSVRLMSMQQKSFEVTEL